MWNGLNNINRLFMEEITYVCNRIDNLHAILNAKKSEELTISTLQYSILAIAINATLVLITLYVTILLNNAGK